MSRSEDDPYHRGLVAMRASRFDESRAALGAAADAGHADARAWHALHALYGYGAPADPGAALAELEAAEAAGSTEAMYQLAVLGWADRLVPRDVARMADRLATAAERDHVRALRALGLVHADEGTRLGADDAAERCFARAATLGDAASYALGAHRVVATSPARRDVALGWLASAASVLARARRRLPPGAKPLRATAPPTGTLPRPALVRERRFEPHVHHRDPLVETVDRMLAPLECEYLILLGEPYLHRSVTVADDGALVPHPDRDSSDVALHGGHEDFASRWLQARMLDWLGVPLAQAEHLILLRYGPGEQYKPHVDWLPAGARGNRPEPDQPGQRVHTVFAYLDGVEAGGQTAFPRIGLQVKPARGRIVHFTNLRADGSVDPQTLHAGQPIERGEKWLATLWSRERDYRSF